MKKYLYVLSVFLFSLGARAQTTYVVNNTADDGPGTLREIINRINTGADPAPYTVNVGIAGPVSLSTALPAITRSCTITGVSMLTPATAAGGTTIERSNTAGNFSVLSFSGNGITVWLQDLILQNGAAGSGEGGALLINANGGTVTMNRCLIRNSIALGGGGARITAGTVTMYDSQFANNTATNVGGSDMYGGALVISCTTFTANRCTFTGNSAKYGGAIDCYATNATLENCTFTSNTTNDLNGIAKCVYVNPGCSVDFIHCSFIANLIGLMVVSNDNGTARFLNCLMAGNMTTNLWFIGEKPTSLGGNVTDNANDSRALDQPTDKKGIRLSYGSLQQNNGGLVATHRIYDCSPATNAGVTSSTAVTIPTTDANNKPRIGAPDAGAFEVQVPTTVSLTAGISGTVTCRNQTLTAALSGGTNGRFVFTGPGLNTTTTSGTAIASQTGTYSVTVTSAEGCPASTTTSVFADTFVSLSLTNSGVLTCSIQTVTLTASSATGGVNFSFTSPGGAIQPTNQVTTNTVGTYSVTATNPQNGCVSSTMTSVTSSTELPGASLMATNGGVIVCGTQTLTLTADSPTNGVSYSFASTNSFTTLGSAILVSSTGQYSVSALNEATGCFSTTSLTVSENLIPPGAVSITRTGAIGCGPNRVTLSAGAAGAVNYTLLPGIQSNTGGQFVVNSTGTYTVVAANGTGAACQSFGITTVDQGTAAVAGPISLAGRPDVANPGRLAASGTGFLFVFTGPNGFVFSNVYRIVSSYSVFALGVTSPGIYTLTVYGTEGCPPASSSITVN